MVTTCPPNERSVHEELGGDDYDFGGINLAELNNYDEDEEENEAENDV